MNSLSIDGLHQLKKKQKSQNYTRGQRKSAKQKSFLEQSLQKGYNFKEDEYLNLIKHEIYKNNSSFNLSQKYETKPRIKSSISRRKKKYSNKEKRSKERQ